jgi:ribosomal protein S27E
MKLETKIVSGECPSCKEHTMLVEIDQHFFRCITCGEDLEQKINGVIKYMKADKNTEMRLRVDID